MSRTEMTGLGIFAFVLRIINIASLVGAILVTVRTVKNRKHCIGAQVCGGIGAWILFWGICNFCISLLGLAINESIEMENYCMLMMFKGAFQLFVGGVLLKFSNKIYDGFLKKITAMAKNDPQLPERCSGSALEAFYVYYRYPCFATLEMIRKNNSFAGDIISQVENSKLSKKKAVNFLREHDAQKEYGTPVPPRMN